jgi:methionine sulfoxide reductase heme-binding subunit
VSGFVSTGPDWYLMRGSGAVSLLLLTAVLALGIATSDRRRLPGLPRFATAGLHRSISLVAVLFLGIHVVTAVLDPYAAIRLVDLFVPFLAGRSPLAAGLGAVAFDLVLALIATSLLRERIAPRLWRLVHRLAYLCWPVAALHGVVIGSDRVSTWMLGVDLACVALLAGSLATRFAVRPSLPALVERTST